ncbi:MAG: hypothetical protein E7189_10940 [Erysipelotrichaceae bacterium]|nr:hypothetical protein [Erysipelotrichaceae bacterium]
METFFGIVIAGLLGFRMGLRKRNKKMEARIYELKFELEMQKANHTAEKSNLVKIKEIEENSEEVVEEEAPEKDIQSLFEEFKEKKKKNI